MKKATSKDLSLYEKFETSNSGAYNSGLPIVFHKDTLAKGDKNAFSRHWHEKMEFLYFIQGQAKISCNAEQIEAKAGNMVVINSNELHVQSLQPVQAQHCYELHLQGFYPM